MKHLIYSLFLIGIVISLDSCKKEEITTYENLIVDGNAPPPYSGIPETKIEIYVSKLYIDVLGKQPTQTELSTDVSYLKSRDLSMESRDTLIDKLMAIDDYYTRLYTTATAKFLEGINDFQINQEINTYNYVISLLYAGGDTFEAQVTEVVRDKLISLKDADSLYKHGTLTVNEFYATFCDNQFYDDINMGSLNFVQACFENYFLRPASTSETTNGVKMVDGESKIILLKNGNSKSDFIKIITESDEFYQGLVMENYRSYLSRDPIPYESFKATVEFKNSKDLASMQKSILKTDEYAGF